MKKDYIRPFMKVTLFEAECIAAAASDPNPKHITAAQVTQNMMVTNMTQAAPNSVTTVQIKNILTFK